MNRCIVAGLISAFIISPAVAQEQIPAIPVWPNGPPGAIIDPGYHEDTVFTETGAARVQHVTSPDLSVFLPPAGSACGTAVIICPGGGYVRLAMPHEGFDVAHWLNGLGVAAFVLKYRLPSDLIMKDKAVGPLQDIQESLRIMRRRAGEWGIDPGKIGVMGFSAGGHLAGSASTLYRYKSYEPADTTSARPDFSLLIYGVISMEPGLTHGGSQKSLLGDRPDSALVNLFSAERQVDRDTPPAFLVHAADDPSVPVASSIAYFTAMHQHSVPAELHVYEKGGHGFGLGRNRGTLSAWPDACSKWLRAHGLLR